MKFAITADLHLKNWKDNQFDEHGTPMKLVEIIGAMEEICKYCIKKRIKDVIIAGDLGDLKGVVHAKSFLLFKELVEKYEKLTFTIISGNHDMTSKDVEHSVVELFTGYKNVKIYTDVVVDEEITYVPWRSNVEEYLEKADPNKILISHFGLSEAKLNSGISLRTNVRGNDLKKFPLVLLGHYHAPQHLQHHCLIDGERGEGNIYYVGSPVQLHRGEAGEDKRFLIVDSNTLEVESIRLENYRKYFSFDIKDTKDIKKILKKVKVLQEEGHHVYLKSDNVNVVKEINTTESDIEIIDNSEEDYETRGITSNMTDREQFVKFLEIHKIDVSEHDKYIDIITTTIG